MKKTGKIKRIMAYLLAFMMLFQGMYTSLPVNAAELSEHDKKTSFDMGMSFHSEDAFGEMVANALETEKKDQKQNDGYNIFSVEMQGNIASVEYETQDDCSLVVAIYDETGIEMLASGVAEVSKEEGKAEITIDTDSMPDYFYIRAFLVSTDSLESLCSVYESPNYTKEMQDFFSKTTDDFSSDRVMNFDNSETTNFAVFQDNVIIIPESTNNSELNKVVSVDEENNIYLIENADDNILSLRVGDVFTYNYGDNQVLIVDIAAIDINGTTVKITGKDTSLEDVFEYVRIEEDAYTGDAQVDENTCGEGVTYLGMKKITEEPAAYSTILNYEGKQDYILQYKLEKELNENENVGVGIDFKFSPGIKLYISKSQQYVEVKMDYEGALQFEISVTNEKFSWQLPNIKFSFIPGVVLELDPTFEVTVTATFNVEGKLSGTVGFSYSLSGGGNSLTTTPKFEISVKLEGSIFVGFNLQPKISIISDKLAYTGFSAKVGAEATASFTLG